MAHRNVTVVVPNTDVEATSPNVFPMNDSVVGNGTSSQTNSVNNEIVSSCLASDKKLYKRKDA